jgi:hypothetical protein
VDREDSDAAAILVLLFAILGRFIPFWLRSNSALKKKQR